MATETKLRIHNTTFEVALCCGIENWIANNRDATELEALRDRTAREISAFVFC
jgi:hypothetical protein